MHLWFYYAEPVGRSRAQWGDYSFWVARQCFSEDAFCLSFCPLWPVLGQYMAVRKKERTNITNITSKTAASSLVSQGEDVQTKHVRAWITKCNARLGQCLFSRWKDKKVSTLFEDFCVVCDLLRGISPLFHHMLENALCTFQWLCICNLLLFPFIFFKEVFVVADINLYTKKKYL